MLIVSAPAGLGKSALVDVAAARGAAAGMDVRRASGDLGEQVLPWSVVLQLFPDVPGLADRIVAEPDNPTPGSPLGLLDRVHRLVASIAAHTPDAAARRRPALGGFAEPAVSAIPGPKNR